MGGAEAKNTVEAYCNTLIQDSSSASQTCWNHINGINSIIIQNNTNYTIEDVEQDVIMSLNVDCAMDVSSWTDIDAKMQTTMDLHVEAVTKGYGFNSADASNYASLAQQMTVLVSQSYSQNLQNEATVENQIIIQNNTGGSTKGLVQSATVDATIKGTMDVVMKTTVATDMESTISEYASAEASASVGLILIAIAVLVVVVLLAVGMFSNLIFNPAFWFLLSSVGLIMSGYFLMAYLPEWWPYKKIHDGDSDEDKKSKKEDNKNELIVWLIMFGIFGAIDLVFVLMALSAHKKKSGGSQGGGSKTGTAQQPFMLQMAPSQTATAAPTTSPQTTPPPTTSSTLSMTIPASSYLPVPVTVSL